MAGQKQNETGMTEAEWAIIQVVWKHQPCAAPTVQELLAESRGWTYSTVKTFMDRMVRKGLLKTTRMRNLMLYSAAITQKRAQKGELRRVIKRAFEGALTPAMHSLLESRDMTLDQLDELEAMIQQKKRDIKP